MNRAVRTFAGNDMATMKNTHSGTGRQPAACTPTPAREFSTPPTMRERGRTIWTIANIAQHKAIHASHHPNHRRGDELIRDGAAVAVSIGARHAGLRRSRGLIAIAKWEWWNLAGRRVRRGLRCRCASVERASETETVGDAELAVGVA